MKIYGSVEWLFCFLVVSLGVEFEDLDDELGNVLDADVDLDVFIFAEQFLVTASEIDLNFILDLLKFTGCYIQIIVDDPFLGVLNSYLLLNGL